MQQLFVRQADETSLSVRWNRPVGQWDAFTVLLTEADAPSTTSQRTLSWGATECTFLSLTPGRRYTVTVTTNSGNLSSSASLKAWTGMFWLF